MKITQPIPSFIGGVSQQPPALRLPSHLEELFNGYASSEEGLSKRPNTEYVAKLATTSSAAAKIHEFNKSTNEQGYVVLKGDGTITIKGFDGASATVNMVAANTYVNGSSDPRNDFELVTIADHTFIVNRTVTPAMKTDLWPDNNIPVVGYDSMLWVRSGNLDTPYSVSLTGLSVSYNPGATSANAATTNISSQLATLINGLGPAPVYGADGTSHGSVLMIGRSAAYDISIKDGRGNSSMVLIRGSTSTPTNLPPNAPSGFQVEITGSEDTDWDNYYVQFNTTKKVWDEIPKPGRKYKIDPATMPHIIKYVSPGVYSFEQVAWNDCLAGDTTTAPEPSFIGNRINDLFFYRGRLGLLTDKSIVLSEAGSIYNFFRTTVTSLVDSDPIDVRVTMTNPAPLRWAVEFDDTVFFTSDRQQYYIDPNVEVLSPRTIAVRATTAYEVDVTCQPIVVGSRLYYTRQRALHSSLHDFYRKGDQTGKLSYASDEVTLHCPRYILGRVKQLKGSAQGDAIFMITDQIDEKIYVFQTKIDESGKRQQAALHRWNMDASNDVIALASNGSSLYLLNSRSDGVFLEKCDLSPKAVDTSMIIKLLLDQRLTEAQVTSITYNTNTGLSTITLPHADSNSSNNPYVMYGRGGSTLARAGESVAVTITASSPNVIFTCEGDWRTDKFYVGKLYTFNATLSQITARDRTTGAPLTQGRLQLSRCYVNYGDTGYLRAVVTPGQRETFSYPLTAHQLGTSETLLGAIPLHSGTFRFPVMANAANVSIQLISEAPFPLKLLNGDWEGQYGSQAVQLARRV